MYIHSWGGKAVQVHVSESRPLELRTKKWLNYFNSSHNIYFNKMLNSPGLFHLPLFWACDCGWWHIFASVSRPLLPWSLLPSWGRDSHWSLLQSFFRPGAYCLGEHLQMLFFLDSESADLEMGPRWLAAHCIHRIADANLCSITLSS